MIRKPLNYCQKHDNPTNQNSGSTRDRINTGNFLLQDPRSLKENNIVNHEPYTNKIQIRNGVTHGLFCNNRGKSYFNCSVFVPKKYGCSNETRSRSEMITLLCEWHFTRSEISLSREIIGRCLSPVPASVTMGTVATACPRSSRKIPERVSFELPSCFLVIWHISLHLMFSYCIYTPIVA